MRHRCVRVNCVAVDDPATDNLPATANGEPATADDDPDPDANAADTDDDPADDPADGHTDGHTDGDSHTRSGDGDSCRPATDRKRGERQRLQPLADRRDGRCSCPDSRRQPGSGPVGEERIDEARPSVTRDSAARLTWRG